MTSPRETKKQSVARPHGPRHPAEAALRRVALGQKGVSARLQAHVRACRDCQEDTRLMAALSPTVIEAATAVLGDCPAAESLVLFARGQLPSIDAPSVRDHVSRCVACAAEHEALARADAEAGKAPGTPSGMARAARSLVDRLRELVSFEMPPALALTLRSGAVSSSSFEQGMKSYRAGRYSTAIEELERARAMAAKLRALPFFLGVALLKENRDSEAVSALREAVRLNASLGEYRWYLAQGLLRQGDAVEAVRQLRKAAALPGPVRLRTRQLAQRVGQILAVHREEGNS